jgi:hypothetical protein
MNMNRKWIPHIIAAAAIVVFSALSLACATLTPEEQAAREAAVKAQQEEYARTRGRLIIKASDTSLAKRDYSPENQLFYVIRPGVGPVRMLMSPTTPADALGSSLIVDKGDTSYTIYYRRPRDQNERESDVKETSDVKDGTFISWSRKVVYIPVGGEVTVEIP